MDEVKNAGVSFFFNFYLDVQQLTNQFAVYESGIVVFENKYSDIYGKDFLGVEQGDKDKILQLASNMRFYLTRCILAYRVVKKDFKQTISKENEDLIKKIKADLIPRCNDVEALLIELTQFVSQGALQDLFTKNEDIIKSLFNTDGSQQPAAEQATQPDKAQ